MNTGLLWIKLLIRILIIITCIVLFGALMTDGDLSNLTLFIQIITLLLMVFTLCELFRRI